MAIRLKLEPDLRRAKNGLAVLGARLRLLAFGPGVSKAKKDAPTPARLVFSGAYLIKPREEIDPAPSPFASIEGEVLLVGPTREPVWRFSAEPAITHDEPEPAEGERVRRLNLEYAAPSFEGGPPPGSPATRLRLPKPPAGARYFELAVALELDGAEEAAATACDRLDVPLATITFFEARVADEEDFPLANERFVLTLHDGSTLDGTTDDDGVAALDPVPRGRIVLAMPDVVEEPVVG